MPQPALLSVQSLCKTYPTPAGDLVVLDGVSLELARAEAVAITGPSGCGKSTLLHILGTLDTATSGSVEIAGQDIARLSERELSRFRGRRIGFVFQDHHLLPQLTALENVLVPALMTGGVDKKKETWAKTLLERVGLCDRAAHFPAELSGGERQRVAVARALVERPALVLCDEPTGNLDETNAGNIRDLLLELCRQEENALVLVTHSPVLAAAMGRELVLRGGKLTGQAAER